MLIVREISVPAPFTVGEHDNVAAMVFEHERDDPDYVIYQRLIDGVWTDVTCAEAANQIRAAALGLISLGVQAGDRVVIFSATRYEWAILDFAIRLWVRSPYRSTRPRQRSRCAGFYKTPKRWCCSPKPTHTRQWSPNSPAACPPCGRYCRSPVRVPTRSIGSRRRAPRSTRPS
ncbi:hypothetical protein DKM05_10325 [Mycobacterium tuberculosis variant bovis]|uniref:AMP-dependent synthetase/ligase domain-containing protein n=1 Tax=Mycobacterium bovis TaxID=1765 RepID=A0AB74LLN9_MYCBI|nr:hypothetical protein C1D11_11860 [Mycobacterium tuberculosis variant bovis]AYP16497.1 hypothetical protein EBF06_12310 [Mycobacterium tuberculosis variant bovis BCG]PRH98926.1 hypothetical protein B8A28_04165 [Mycobacterium tuberculosis variant caprae]OPF76670.1 hypothetical protein BXP25_18550 [Mycobacterium tuberculosis variant bovis]OPF95326.1 hypothetical protein BXP24_03370 [Mycobacterium tuberculosis variant bovis]